MPPPQDIVSVEESRVYLPFAKRKAIVIEQPLRIVRTHILGTSMPPYITGHISSKFYGCRNFISQAMRCTFSSLRGEGETAVKSSLVLQVLELVSAAGRRGSLRFGGDFKVPHSTSR